MYLFDWVKNRDSKNSSIKLSIMAKNIRHKTRKRIYDTIVQPVNTYGSEIRQLTRSHKKKLSAVEIDFWRRAARKSTMEHIRNEKIRSLVKVE